MAAPIFVAGGSGFVGAAVLDELSARGHLVNALSNRRPLNQRVNLQTISGDSFDSKALDAGMAGCRTAINLVGIIFEKPGKGITFDRIHIQGTQAMVDAARRNGVQRFIQLSALGVRPNAASRYHQTKFAAEQVVRQSGLQWTILQPSIIHGPRGDFMRQVANWARHRAPPFLFMPYFGAGLSGTQGAGRLQPVFVGDVARALVDAIENPKTAGQTYTLGGTEVFTWPQMLRLCSEAITGRPRLTAPIPIWFATLLTRIVPAPLLPFNRDQVTMVREDSVADLARFQRDFGWSPQSFAASLAAYARSL